MLDKHEISIGIGTLFTYTGFVLGVGLLALAQILDVDDLARWAITVVMIVCTYSVHRSMAARDDRLRQAFEMGRQHERSSLTSVV